MSISSNGKPQKNPHIQLARKSITLLFYQKDNIAIGHTILHLFIYELFFLLQNYTNKNEQSLSILPLFVFGFAITIFISTFV